MVTGSRIVRSSFNAPTPLQSFDAEQIELSAESNIGDFLNQLPAFGEPTFTRTSTGFSVAGSGQTNVDLRDLGSSRTLTLVNGRRHVAGFPGISAVDLNAIPSALVERVEIITGGAAAVYGSDAVAGVTNFIYKTDFEGLDFNVSYGATTEHNDDTDTNVNLLLGHNFEDGKGNAVLFLGYNDQGAVYSRDRERTRLDALRTSSDPLGPRRIPVCSSGPPQGRFNVNDGPASQHWTYGKNGMLKNSFTANGATDCEDGFNRSAYRTIAIPTERRLFGSNVHWNLTDNTRLFFEGTYVSTSTDAVIEPFFLNIEDAFPGGIGVPVEYMGSNGMMISSPFIPAPVLAAAKAYIATQTDPNDPPTGDIGVVRRMVEFGPRTAVSQRRTYRSVFGIEGDLFGTDWSYDLSYNYGQTTQEQRSEGRMDLNALRQALLNEEDPTVEGAYRCVNEIAREQGCIPIDLFGGIGSIGPVMTARGLRDPRPYITAPNTIQAKIEQTVIQGNITGSAFELPAGPVGLAFGFEKREEKSQDVRDPLVERGLSTSNAIPSVFGSFDVTEFYAEIDVPILANSNGDPMLNFGAAARMSDYSSIGDVTSWEARIEFLPLPDLRLRAAHARPVRAPNIDELFAAAGETFAQVNDPCIGIEGTGGGATGDNCRSIPEVMARITMAAGNTAVQGFQITQAELQGTSGLVGEGNMNLFEESGITTTFGATYTFSFADSVDVSLSMDWFDVEVEDAIDTISQNNTLDLCYSSQGLSSPLCANVYRYGSTHPNAGALRQVDTQVINTALLTSSGIDTVVNVGVDMGGAGRLRLNLTHTYLLDWTITPMPGGAKDEDTGEIGNAEFRWLGTATYEPNDDWKVSGTLRYIAESRLDNNVYDNEDCAGFASGCTVDGIYYLDLRASYDFSRLVGWSGQVYLGLENALDEDPPILGAGLSGAGSDTGTETNADVYDAIGRGYYVGVKFTL